MSIGHKGWAKIPECKRCKKLQTENKRLKIQLDQYEEDSTELFETCGVDPDDKVDREDLKL